MARVTFEEATEMQSANNPNYVESFALKNDGDEALVRFMHDDVKSFDIVTTHGVTINGKFRSVNCLRNPKDPMEACPLCATGANTQNVMFIHLIEYSRDSNGNIVPVPKVWARGLSYATRIKSLINEYGPLSNYLFKIHRNGAAGSRDTSYDILFAPEQIYPSQNYPIPEGVFQDYSATGTIVLDKSFADLTTFVNTGRMPEDEPKENQSYGNGNYAPPATQFAPAGNSVGGPQLYTPQPQVAPVAQPSSPHFVPATGTPVAPQAPTGMPSQFVPQAPTTGNPMQYYAPPVSNQVISRPVRN